MKTLTKAQKDFAIERLKSQWKQVKLKCDGHTVDLQLVQVKNTKLAISVYVNSYFKGVWFTKPDEHVESKFLPIITKAFYSSVEKKKIIKEFGKRNAYKYFPNLDEKYVGKGSHFLSGRTAINHLIKVSDSIELVTEMPA